RELTDQPLWISANVATIENLDSRGSLIKVDAKRDPPDVTLLDKAIERIRFKSAPRVQHQWLLIDGRTRAIVARGTDDLLTVSQDGRYAVTTGEDPSRLKVYELPLRRSML